MNYELIDMGAYNLHIIKTKRFKTITVNVLFRTKIKKEEITIRNLLREVLFNSNKDYKTERLLSMAIEKLYDLKLGISSFSTGNYTNLSFVTRFLNEKYTEKGMNEASIRFLLDIILKPNIINNSFDKIIVEQEKKKIEKGLMSLPDNKQRYAIYKLLSSTKDMPYSYNLYGYKEDLNKITEDSLYKYYQELLSTNHIDIFVVGDVNTLDIKEIFKDYFKTSVFHKKEKDVIVKELLPRKRIVKLSEQSDVNQSQLTLLCTLNNLTDFERKYVVKLYNEILGGSSNSLLFDNVREKKSYAYYIYSETKTYDNITYICSGIENGNEEKVLLIIKKVIQKISKGNFDDSLLEACKENLISNILSTEDNPMGLIQTYYASYLANTSLNKEKIEKIKSVTKNDIINISKKIKLHTMFVLKGDKDAEN